MWATDQSLVKIWIVESQIGVMIKTATVFRASVLRENVETATFYAAWTTLLTCIYLSFDKERLQLILNINLLYRWIFPLFHITIVNIIICKRNAQWTSVVWNIDRLLLITHRISRWTFFCEICFQNLESVAPSSRSLACDKLLFQLVARSLFWERHLEIVVSFRVELWRFVFKIADFRRLLHLRNVYPLSISFGWRWYRILLDDALFLLIFSGQYPFLYVLPQVGNLFSFGKRLCHLSIFRE